MNSREIYEAIVMIANNSSKNIKQGLVLHYGQESEEFKRVLVAALNPLITYGIKKHPGFIDMPIAGREPGMFDERTWEVLNELAERRITGGVATDTLAIELGRLNIESAELLWRIVIKDLKAGFGDSTVNKCFKGLIPDFPYMRCALPKDTDLTAWPWSSGVFSQEKADGMFANIDHEDGGLVRITSRQGSEFPIDKFEQLAEEVRTRTLSGMQHHGEIIVKRGDEVLERQIGNGMLNSVLNGGEFEEGCRPVYMVWDAIPLVRVMTKGKYEVSYRERLLLIVKLLRQESGSSIEFIPTKLVHSISEAFAHYREFLKAGKEGTVIKHPHAIWRDGTSKEQIKLKLEVDVDLQVIAIVPGKDNGKNAGRAGSLTCVTNCGQLQVDVTVKNEAMRDQIDSDPENWIDRIIVVRANSILEPSDSNPLNSLFLPRMVETTYRMDKDTADSLQRVRDQFESAIAA